MSGKRFHKLVLLGGRSVWITSLSGLQVWLDKETVIRPFNGRPDNKTDRNSETSFRLFSYLNIRVMKLAESVNNETSITRIKNLIKLFVQ